MKQSPVTPHSSDARYDTVFHCVAGIVEAAKLSAARSVNAHMTGAYWIIGRHIVEYEQSGEERAAYGANLIERLATDMTRRFGRGYSRQNLWQMRQFGLAYPPKRILQTLSGESAQPLPRSSNLQTASGDSSATPTNVPIEDLIASFPLPWSAYVRLLSVKNPRAREFYEAETLPRTRWVRHLHRQINFQFSNFTAPLRTRRRSRPAASTLRARHNSCETKPVKNQQPIALLSYPGAFLGNDTTKTARHLDESRRLAALGLSAISMQEKPTS